jgi:nucleoside-diphosphate-sugar epimerase
MRLITGGSGFLGVALAKKLKELGHNVIVYDLAKSPKLSDNIDFIKGDILDYEKLKSVTKGVEIIYHLAALIPQRRRKEKEMYAVNVEGTKNALNCAVKNNVKRFVYISSVQVYGKYNGIIKEDAKCNPVGFYAKNKLESEKLCFEYFKKYNLSINILRPPTIIGPGIDDKYVLSMLSIIKNNGILPVIGNGLQKYNAIFISDCVEAVILASENKNNDFEIFNIGCEDVIPYIELIKELKKEFNSKVKVIKLNKTIVINFLRFLDFLKLSPVEKVYIELSPYSNLMDISKIKNKLGWIPKRGYLESWKETYKDFLKRDKS